MPKVMVSLPQDLLEDLDREARRRGSTRSGLLATAARRELLQENPAVVDEALARARAELDEARLDDAVGSLDSAELVRRERDR